MLDVFVFLLIIELYQTRIIHHDKSPFGVVQGAGSINVKQLHLQVLSCWFLPDLNREVFEGSPFSNPSKKASKVPFVAPIS